MVCFTKLITVKRLMSSCWRLYNTEAVFSFFEMPFDLLAEVFVVFTIVCSTGASWKCYSFFISSYRLFIFCSYLLFLMFEFDNFLEGLFPYLLYLLPPLSEQSFFYMFPLLLGSVLSVLLIPLVGVMLVCNISA